MWLHLFLEPFFKFLKLKKRNAYHMIIKSSFVKIAKHLIWNILYFQLTKNFHGFRIPLCGTYLSFRNLNSFKLVFESHLSSRWRYLYKKVRILMHFPFKNSCSIYHFESKKILSWYQDLLVFSNVVSEILMIKFMISLSLTNLWS